jgi:hypothetical protein
MMQSVLLTSCSLEEHSTTTPAVPDEQDNHPLETKFGRLTIFPGMTEAVRPPAVAISVDLNLAAADSARVCLHRDLIWFEERKRDGHGEVASSGRHCSR